MSDFKKVMDSYVQVKDRIAQFREEHGANYGLESEMLFHEPGVACTMKAIIKDKEGFVIATGHSHEKTSDNTNVNITSLIENCETSAWGRALANFGYKIQNSIASREEVRHLEPKVFTGTKPQQAKLNRCLRAQGVTDTELVKVIYTNLIEDQVQDDELSITKFIKEFKA